MRCPIVPRPLMTRSRSSGRRNAKGREGATPARPNGFVAALGLLGALLGVLEVDVPSHPFEVNGVGVDGRQDKIEPFRNRQALGTIVFDRPSVHADDRRQFGHRHAVGQHEGF